MSDAPNATSISRGRSAWFSQPRDAGLTTEQRFEFDSRGDRVPGRLWLPRGAPSERLVLALHPLGSSARDAVVASAAARGAAAGFAFAAIDLPLHGDRHNAKLSKRAVAAASAGAESADEVLWRGLVAQAAADLTAALDALAAAAPMRTAIAAFAGTIPIALAHAGADRRVERLVAIGLRAEKPFACVDRPDDLLAALDPW